jgi:purine-nucleoside phosphorylase
VLWWIVRRSGLIHRDEMTDQVQRLRDHRAETGIILGSGLNSLVGDPSKQQMIPYAAFQKSRSLQSRVTPDGSFWARSKRPKSFLLKGAFIFTKDIQREVTSIVRVVAEAGIKQLVVTNTAGALNPKFKPGEWMMITDHINVTGASPLSGSAEFLDLTDAYSPRLREKFRGRTQD